MAIVPANVLIASSSFDWTVLATPLVLQQDLITTHYKIPVFATNNSAVYQLNADQVLRTTLEKREGQLRLQATLVDTPTQLVRQVAVAEGHLEAGVLPLLNAVAKELDTQATMFSTKSDKALESFTAAVATSDATSRVQLLTSAARMDPGFGLARIALIETLTDTKSRDVETETASAVRASSSFTRLDRQRFDALTVRLSNAPLARRVSATQAVLALAPNDTDALVMLGSTKILEGEISSGEQVLRKAAWINPANASIQRQLAQGLLNAGKYGEAERILSTLPNRQALLPEIAIAVLLNGDKARAGAIFDQYLQLRPPNDSVSVLLKANWLAIAGEVSQAIGMLSGGRFSNALLQSVAFSEIAVWQLMMGDRAASKRTASLAARVPGSFSEFAVLLAKGDENPEQWRREVDQSRASAADKQLLLGYGFFLANRFPEAVQVWQKLLSDSGDSDLQSRAMLAAALDRAGRQSEARRLQVQAFVPDLANLYAAVSFNEMRRLSGRSVSSKLKVQ